MAQAPCNYYFVEFSIIPEINRAVLTKTPQRSGIDFLLLASGILVFNCARACSGSKKIKPRGIVAGNYLRPGNRLILSELQIIKVQSVLQL